MSSSTTSPEHVLDIDSTTEKTLKSTNAPKDLDNTVKVEEDDTELHSESEKDDGADKDYEANSAKDDCKLRLIKKDKPQGPYKWTITHQLIWMRDLKRRLPENLFSYHASPLESIATPINVDLSMLTIELTAKEILTFFPRHFIIPEIQDRFSRNNIKGTFQAMFINLQRNPHIPYIILPRQVRSANKQATKRYGKPDGFSRCTTYMTSHYTFSSAQENKIPYPLINCADGIHPADFPEGVDAGPFTKALVHAQVMGHDGVMLEVLDAYLEMMGIEWGLDKGYSDVGFMQRHADVVKMYQGVLREEAAEKGYKWDT